jgi:hypothetical protein
MPSNGKPSLISHLSRVLEYDGSSLIRGPTLLKPLLLSVVRKRGGGHKAAVLDNQHIRYPDIECIGVSNALLDEFGDVVTDSSPQSRDWCGRDQCLARRHPTFWYKI